MSFLESILAEKSKNRLIAPCIYTTGYAAQDFAQLPELLNFLDAVLIDIRFAPASASEIQWRKDYLRLLLKERYRHVPLLGNRLSKDLSRPSIQNLTLGIKIITELRTNLVLMCECAEEKICHRRFIAENLLKQGFHTQEIGGWKSLK